MAQEKELRILQLTDYASLIENLNYNFSVLLSSPLYQGVQGKPGKPGDAGKSGIRGTRWMFADFVALNREFPEITSPAKLTPSFFISKIQSPAESQRLYAVLNHKNPSETGDSDYFVEGDIIVANSKIYVFDGFTVRDTKENVAGNSTTNNEELIAALINQKLSDSDELSRLLQTFVPYRVTGKNFPDSSNRNNNVKNNTTAIDIDITSDNNIVVPGIKLEDRKIYGVTEGMVTRTDLLTMLVGAPQRYHDIVQNSLRDDPTSTVSQTTSNSAPNLTRQPSFVVLQNDKTSGITLGFKNADTFLEFGNIYVNDNNELVLSPPVVGATTDTIASIKLSPNHITLTGNVKVNGRVTEIEPEVDEMRGRAMFLSRGSKNDSDPLLHIGDMKKDTHIYGRRVAVPYLAGAQLLTVTVDGWLKNSGFSVSTKKSIDSEESSDKILVNALQLHSVNKKLLELKKQLEEKDGVVINQVDDALLPVLGSITDVLCTDDMDIDTLINQLFDETGRGKEECQYTLFGGRVLTANLSSYAICDGRLAPRLEQIPRSTETPYHTLKLMYIGH